MAIACVHLSADVFMVCLSHALVTEKEEVMGLLIGEVDEERVSHVSAVIMLRRSDKRKDRVEISPEQLSDASTQAERLAHQLNKPLRVLGWYHSHPHITVWPSHVDVQTQAMYQMMDVGFIGIIVSVFSEEGASTLGHIQLTCFQSANRKLDSQTPQYMRIEIPVHIVPTPTISRTCLEALTLLPAILCHEEQETFGTDFSSENNILRRLYNEAVFTKAICNIAEVTSVPLVQALENRLQQNKVKLGQLLAEKQKLMQQITI